MKIVYTILVIILAVLASGCTAPSSASPAEPVPASGSVTTPANSAEIPSLVGTWTGSAAGHVNRIGFRNEGAPVYNITEQNGRAFAGYTEYSHYSGGDRKIEEFSGVINMRNEIVMAQNEAGFTIGDLLGPDTIELAYAEDGDDAKAFLITLTRQKS